MVLNSTGERTNTHVCTDGDVFSIFYETTSSALNPLTPTVATWWQRVKPSFVIFDIRALWRSGLTRCTHVATQWVSKG